MGPPPDRGRSRPAPAPAPQPAADAIAAATGATADTGAGAGIEPGGRYPASSSLTRLITICGSNGLTSTPSQPTARARFSSIGSNAPVSSTTGMCEYCGVLLTNAATS